MKRLLIFAFAIVSVFAISVTTNSCKTVESPEQVYADSVANNIAKLRLKHRRFVLTANQITINNSSLLNVSDNTNFVLVDSLNGVVQLAPLNTGGPNRVGGFTLSGDVSNYEIKDTNDGDVIVTYRLTGSLGSTDVRIQLYKGKNRADATINATFNKTRALLRGEVNALNTQYFEGRSF